MPGKGVVQESWITLDRLLDAGDRHSEDRECAMAGGITIDRVVSSHHEVKLDLGGWIVYFG